VKIGPRAPVKVPELPDLTCPECGSPMRLVETLWDDHPWQYRCSRSPLCSGTHGAHPDGRPLGIPGDAATKLARIAAHDVFDRLWKSGAMRRSEAYEELDAALGNDPGCSHFGAMSISECKRAEAWARERLLFLQGQPKRDWIDQRNAQRRREKHRWRGPRRD
jgi:ssDNA-binding Zn-finger/Zn-ribbon topoisomerase 1